MHESVITSDG